MLDPKWFIGSYVPCGWDRLSKIYTAFPKTYEIYLEPFAGTATVALNQSYFQKRRDDLEIAINDKRTLFKAITTMLTTNYQFFETAMTNFLSSQIIHQELIADFYQLRFLPPDLYSIFGAYISCHSFPEKYTHYAIRHAKDRLLYISNQQLGMLAKRLNQMQIHYLDYQKFLLKYIQSQRDKSIFIYLDPPAPPYGWTLEEWALQNRGQNNIFDWHVFAEFIQQIDSPNISWLLQSYSPYTTQLFNQYQKTEIGSFVYDNHTYPYTFITNYRFKNITENTIHYDYTAGKAISKFEQSTIKTEADVYNFFPKNISGIFQPLARSYNALVNLPIDCQCVDKRSKTHLNHMPLILLNDSRPFVNELAKIILEHQGNLYDTLKNNLTYKKLVLNVCKIMKETFQSNFPTRSELLEILKKLQVIQFFSEPFVTFMTRALDLDSDVFFYFEPPFQVDFNDTALNFDHLELYQQIKAFPKNIKWLINYNSSFELLSLYSDYIIDTYYENSEKYYIIRNYSTDFSSDVIKTKELMNAFDQLKEFEILEQL